MTVLDPISDTNGAELHRLAKLFPLPDFVKQASMDETLRPGALNATVYADPVNKLYPCHTPAATYISAMFFAEKRGAFNSKTAARVEQRLDHYVDYWAIKPAVAEIRTKVATSHKTSDDELADSDFAVVYVLDDGHKERHCRIKNSSEVKAAAGWLFQYRDQLPFADRHIIAEKILTKAARYGADLGEHDLFVERQAGHGVCNPKEAAVMLSNRAKLAKSAEQREAMTKLAALVATKPAAALAPATLIKLAETVDGYDRANGLSGQYTKLIPRAEDVLFAVTLKEARAAVNEGVPLVTGNVYARNDFTRIKLADLQDLFGKSVVAEIADGLNVDAEKLAELAQTFPRDSAELFERILDEAGISPLMAKHASNGNIPATTLASLAAQY